MTPLEHVETAMRQQRLTGACNAAPILTTSKPAPSTAPRVTLILGEPARSHTLDSYTTCVDIGPGMSEETTHEVIHHFEATPERVQIDMSKADAQLLQGLLSNVGGLNESRLRGLLVALNAAGLPYRALGHVVIDGRQETIRSVFPGLK